MKKVIYILTMSFLFFVQTTLAQMDDGEYTFSNDKVTLKLTVIDDGWTISTVTLTNNMSKKTSKGTGEWFKVNPNGVDEDYQGPLGWYQFQTTDCNYDFEVPKEKLILNQYDCSNGQSKDEYTLINKSN
jgi:hypothetical protein